MGLLDPFNTHVLVALQGSKVVGFATGTYLAVVNMGFVGYLAPQRGTTRGAAQPAGRAGSRSRSTFPERTRGRPGA
jgi:hypothetical protein